MSTAPLEYILSSTYNTSGLPELPSISHIQITITDQTTEQIIVLFRGGRVRAPKTAIPHVVVKENRNTASKFTQIRGTQREYSSKTLEHSIVKRILVLKR